MGGITTHSTEEWILQIGRNATSASCACQILQFRVGGPTFDDRQELGYLLAMRRFDEMIQLAKRDSELTNKSYWLGRAYLEKGMIDEALTNWS